MTKKEIKIRLTITNVLFWLGFIVSLCAIGHLDYLNEHCAAYGVDELWEASVKAVVGLSLMAAGMLVGRDLEFDEESEDDNGQD